MKMPLFDQELLAGTVEVPEELTVVMSRELAANGYLFGASTCTVLAGARIWFREHGRPEGTSVVVSPDQGGQYCATLYNDDWVDSVLPGWRKYRFSAL